MSDKYEENALAQDKLPAIPSDLLHAIVSQFPRQYYPSETIIFQSGEAAIQMYLVLSGHVKVMKRTSSGKEMILSVVSPGNFIGEPELFEGNENYTFHATMMVSGELVLIQRDVLQNMLENNRQWMAAYLNWLGRENQKYQTKFRDLFLYGKTGALYSMLIRLKNTYGSLKPEGYMIHMPFTIVELSSMIGASSAYIYRQLKYLNKLGVITYENGVITIKDMDFLRRKLNCDGCSADPCQL